MAVKFQSERVDTLEDLVSSKIDGGNRSSEGAGELEMADMGCEVRVRHENSFEGEQRMLCYLAE